MTTKSSDVNDDRLGIVNANVMLPSKSFETTTCVRSAAPPTASPCASVKVAVAAPAPSAPRSKSPSIAAKKTMRLPKRPPSFARELVEDSRVDRLWAPWRLEYIKSADEEQGCIFCLAAGGGDDDVERLVLHCGTHTFALLNKFPYASGHFMVAPLRHVGEYGELTDEEVLELHRIASAGMGALAETYGPQGFNLGWKLGRDAGAVLLAQVREVRLRIKRRAGGAPQRFLRRELAPVAVHVLAEPVAQRRELTPFDLLLQVRNVVEKLLPNLHRHHCSKQVRREVADRA